MAKRFNTPDSYKSVLPSDGLRAEILKPQETLTFAEIVQRLRLLPRPNPEGFSKACVEIAFERFERFYGND